MKNSQIDAEQIRNAIMAAMASGEITGNKFREPLCVSPVDGLFDKGFEIETPDGCWYLINVTKTYAPPKDKKEEI